MVVCSYDSEFIGRLISGIKILLFLVDFDFYATISNFFETASSCPEGC